jgi:hypothetical protein
VGLQSPPLLVRQLRAMRRYDLLLPIASVLFTLQALAILVARAEADRDIASARRLKAEAMRNAHHSNARSISWSRRSTATAALIWLMI